MRQAPRELRLRLRLATALLHVGQMTQGRDRDRLLRACQWEEGLQGCQQGAGQAGDWARQGVLTRTTQDSVGRRATLTRPERNGKRSEQGEGRGRMGWVGGGWYVLSQPT
jgi:hypothetical protein